MSKKHEIRRLETGVSRIIPSTQNMADNAYVTLHQQIERLRLKSGQGNILTDKEIKSLHLMIQSMLMLARDEREREKVDSELLKLEKMSTEELLDYVSKSRKVEEAT